jgi:hypothetical protein
MGALTSTVDHRLFWISFGVAAVILAAVLVIHALRRRRPKGGPHIKDLPKDED